GALRPIGEVLEYLHGCPGKGFVRIFAALKFRISAADPSIVNLEPAPKTAPDDLAEFQTRLST
ncbi:MAG TPA: hypothetical protein VMV27_01520, partial [Candidatus Binataceae bacterium]|nr:hypothetical protein [Candidatus Binataceae bacterium]